MSQHKRDRSMMQKLVGHAPQQPFAKSLMAIATHDQEIDLLPAGFGEQRCADAAVTEL